MQPVVDHVQQEPCAHEGDADKEPDGDCAVVPRLVVDDSFVDHGGFQRRKRPNSNQKSSREHFIEILGIFLGLRLLALCGDAGGSLAEFTSSRFIIARMCLDQRGKKVLHLSGHGFFPLFFFSFFLDWGQKEMNIAQTGTFASNSCF